MTKPDNPEQVASVHRTSQRDIRRLSSHLINLGLLLRRGKRSGYRLADWLKDDATRSSWKDRSFDR